MELNTILVPTDFSDSAEAALAAAAEFAKQFDARIVLLHACRIDLPAVFAAEGSFVFPPGLHEAILAEAKERVEGAAAAFAKKEGLEVEGLTVEERPETAILEAATRLPAEMIVMGTRGLTGLKHVVLGSVAERVVRLAECPVLTVNAPT